MDINSLLSPQDSPARETPSPFPTASNPLSKKRPSGPEKRASSSLSQSIIPPPHSANDHLPLSHAAITQAQQETPSPTVASFGAQSDRLPPSTTSTPTVENRGTSHVQETRMNMPSRQPSTPQMDTLAGTCEGLASQMNEKNGGSRLIMDTDLASMQQHQQVARQNANGLRSSELYEAQRSPVK